MSNLIFRALLSGLLWETIIRALGVALASLNLKKRKRGGR